MPEQYLYTLPGVSYRHCFQNGHLTMLSDASPATLAKLVSCAILSRFVEGWFFSGSGLHFPGPAITCLGGFYSCMKANSGQRSLADMLEAQILQTHRAQTESN